MTENEDKLTEMLSYLCSPSQNNFFALVASRLNRRAAPGLGTLGVGLEGGRYTLFWDPKTVGSFDARQLKMVLQHEVMHIIMNHIPRYLNIQRSYIGSPMMDVCKVTYNIAMDAAVHEVMKEEYPEILTRSMGHPLLDNLITASAFDLPADFHYELYQSMLLDRYKDAPEQVKQFMDALQQSLDAEGDGDGKEEGDEDGEGAPTGNGAGAAPPSLTGDPILDKMIENAMRQHQFITGGADLENPGEGDRIEAEGRSVVREVMDKFDPTKGDGRGTLPHGIQLILDAYLAPPLVSWEELLTQQVEKTNQTKKSRGMQRPSKSMMAVRDYAQQDTSVPQLLSRIMPYPGTKKDRRFTIDFYWDVSGSVSNDDCKEILAQLETIRDALPDAEIHVASADTEIQHEYDLLPGDKMDWTRHGCGGTDFDAVFDHIRFRLETAHRKPDVAIFATDGFAPVSRTPLAIPLIWVITKGGMAPPQMAGHTTIPMGEVSEHENPW